MPTFQIRIEALAATNVITGKPVPALTDNFTVEAADRRAAYRMAPVYMTIRPSGQELEIYIDGTRELGNH
jgi:hypothetical protein